jgi:hypothetical protein
VDPSLEPLIRRLNSVTEKFSDLREGVNKAVEISDRDPEMALTRVRKVMELVIREVYTRRCNEPTGTRPLENLLQRLVKDEHLPTRIEAYASTIRKLGNTATHDFSKTITIADFHRSLNDLIPIFEWYANERPDVPTGEVPKGSMATSADQETARQPRALKLNAAAGGNGCSLTITLVAAGFIVVLSSMSFAWPQIKQHLNEALKAIFAIKP